MNREFIPFEQALELKELGFNEECLSTYTWDGFKYDVLTCISENQAVIKSRLNINNDKYTCSAPLYQQAFRWFREKYGIYCWVTMELGYEKTFCWVLSGEHISTQYESHFKTHEEAELACLKKLIEIVKSKKE